MEGKPTQSERSTVQDSGKLLIFGILTIALLLAGASWWFRYNATHRAAQFWGPEAARLIRDAPIVEFVEKRDVMNPDQIGESDIAGRDISRSHGLSHLRNALLEDRSFDWSPPGSEWPIDWRHWGLQFRLSESASPLVIWFSEDFRRAMAPSDNGQPAKVVSCEPIAKGLAEMFGEFADAPPAR